MRIAICCFDKPDSHDLRAATRPDHLAYLSDFDIEVGGPMKDEDGNMIGSLIITEFDDLEAARTFAANDPYNIAGLFEMVSIREFHTIAWPN